MLPVIGAALGLVQQNQQKEEDRKKAMEAAAMGKFGDMPPPSNSGKSGLMGAVGGALGGMLGGDKPEAPSSMPLGPDGAQKLTPQGDQELDAALGTPQRNADDDMDALQNGSGRTKFL